MTTISVLSAPASGSNTGISRTFSRAAATGASLIAWMHHTAASTNTMTGAIDNASNAFTEDYTGLDSTQGGSGEGIRVYRRTNIANAATSYTPQAPSATGAYGGLLEVVGMDNAAPYVGTTYTTDSTTSHAVAFTTTNTNAIMIVGVRSSTGLGTISSLGSGWVDVGLSRSGTNMFYNPDMGSAGAKTLTFTSASAGGAGGAHYYIAEYKAAVSDPTVSTVTGTTVTEGGNIVFTVTLSGATNRTTNYATSFSGTSTSADYNNALGSATYSNSVTASGSDLVVPSGVSSFTVTIATTQDALDEDDETLVLRVGGVDSTGGSITDDDAAPEVSVSDATENAGEVIFTVSLSAASGKSITVDYATADGTSTAGVDYTAKTGTLTFAAGETTKTVTVTVP